PGWSCVSAPAGSSSAGAPTPTAPGICCAWRTSGTNGTWPGAMPPRRSARPSCSAPSPPSPRPSPISNAPWPAPRPPGWRPRAPTARGRWGEVQLRSIVEAAGMLEHADFSAQTSGTRADGEKRQRPDLVVHLAGDRHVVVDAKAPMDAYLDATEETDPERAAA